MLVFKYTIIAHTIIVKITESGLSFFFIFFLIFYFLLNLFSIFLFIELRVRVDSWSQITRHKRKK